MKNEHEESEQQSDWELMSPDVSAAQTRAEIDSQVSTAKKYPRQISKVKANMLSFATLDPETAAACFYALPRGGKTIQGPSVRLAEIAVACYQNLRVATRIISQITEGANPHVVVQAVCHDLENNSAVLMEKRRRVFQKKTQDGTRLPVSEDDINLAVNSCSAIAFRDAVFKVVPGALIKPVFEASKKCAVGDLTSLNERRHKMIDAFAKMGATKERVFAAVGVKGLDEVGLEQIETLIGIHTALKDGSITLEAAFPEIKKPESTVSQGFNPTPAGGTAATTPETPEQQQKRTRRTKEQMAAARATEAAGTPDTSNADLNPQPVTTPGAPAMTALEQLAKKMDDNHITTAALHKVITELDILKDESLTSLKEINELEPLAIENALKHWDALLPNLKIA